jgi:hypothetical protein
LVLNSAQCDDRARKLDAWYCHSNLPDLLIWTLKRTPKGV